MSLDKAIKNLRYDKRLIEIHIHRGVLTKAEVDKYIAELPDLAHNIELASESESDEDFGGDLAAEKAH
ncbi:MAG: hypothetical protein IPK04_04675 [Bdellovibrionales bacterium]|jgi:hypothetical protein|nr:hypothetical protein [Bdellovibrionales bacterium]MBL7669279.1 hypothetical protein [Pseudobdellovibrionaceae bacterium]